MTTFSLESTEVCLVMTCLVWSITNIIFTCFTSFKFEGTFFGIFKGRVSRFGACASDDVSAVKLIVIGPIRSEYTTPAGYYSLLAGYL